tara:strand:- start:34 stop:225 length:192 start_codon:yes stop_codon:yes gene_type:complete
MEIALQDVFETAKVTNDHSVTTTYLRDSDMRDRLNGLQGTLTPVDININENTSAYREVIWVKE